MADNFIFYFMAILLAITFIGSIIYLAYRDKKQKAGLKKNEAIVFGIKWTWGKYRLGNLLQSDISIDENNDN